MVAVLASEGARPAALHYDRMPEVAGAGTAPWRMVATRETQEGQPAVQLSGNKHGSNT